MDFDTFQEHLAPTGLSCTPEKYAEIEPHIVEGGSAAPADGNYIELGIGQTQQVAGGDALPPGIWARLDDEAVHDLIRQGALASAVPTRRPY
jgi:hypothetical protein